MFWTVKTEADLIHITIEVDGRPPATLLAEAMCDRAERVIHLARSMVAAGQERLGADMLGLPLEGFTPDELFDLAAEAFDVAACALAEQQRERILVRIAT